MVVLQLDTGEELDLNGDIPISLNYSIADIKEPNKRNSAFSKSIMLPGTNNNNNILKHIYKINIEGGFDPNIRQVATILQDGITVLDGFMQLLEVLEEGSHIIYKVVVFGDNGEFMSNIEGLSLSDINFSDLNHDLTLSNIHASWAATKGAGYMYPLVDNGFTDGITWKIESFRPAIYVKEYIDRIFDNAGYTFTSTFFDSSYFKSLIIPYTGGQSKLSDAAQENKSFHVSMTMTYIVPTNHLVFWSLKNSDPGNNGGLSQYTMPTNGAYTFELKLSNIAKSSRGDVKLVLFRGGVRVSYLWYWTNPQTYGYESFNELIWTTIAPTMEFQAGDTVKLEVRSESGSRATIGAGSHLKIRSVNTSLTTGDQVNVNLTTSAIKQTDFFMSLVKMHNLYVSPDPDNKKNLLIEPREDYYSSTTVDFTSKLDRSQTLSIKPLGELGGRKYTFKYKEDKDYYNKLYQSKYLETSGQRTVYSTNQFLKNEVKTELVFSPSVIFGDRWQNGEPLRYPYYSDDSVYDTPVPDGFTTNIKILIYTDRAPAPIWYTESAGVRTAAPSTFGFYIYPFCSHLNHPTQPTVDISFGAPKELFTAYTNYTNNNLYNKYWSKFVEEILDPNSKVVSGKFLLNAADINNLDFRKQYLVDNYLLRLNSVKGYDPNNSSSLCTMEFVKIKEAATFSASTTSSFGGIKKEI